MALDVGQSCPGPERLAEYADGVLGPEERAAVERHLAECADCRAVVAETMAFVETELERERPVQPVAPTPAGAPTVVPFRRRQWVTATVATLAAAAALVLAVRAIRPQWSERFFGPRTDRPELQELIAALANEPTRPVEGRLTGGFKYAPPPSPTRGPGEREVSPDVRIAAAKIEKLAGEKDTPESEAALGVAYLALGDLDNSIRSLEDATTRRPMDVASQTDLAAAYIARATRTDSKSDWPKALAAAERALKIDPRRPEAHFNRALALEGLHLRSEAERAWEAFEATEIANGWQREAAERLKKLRERPTVSTDPALLDNQSIRERLEDRLLTSWANTFLHGDVVASRNVLADASRLADIIAVSGGDTMALDEIVRIRRVTDTNDGRQLNDLAKGHSLFGHARTLFLEERLREATDAMSQAAIHLRNGGSAYAWWSPVFEGIFQRMRGSPSEALDRLASIPIEELPESYRHLLGRIAWTKALGFESLGRLDSARASFEIAIDSFRRAGEVENLTAVQNHAAEVAWLLGDRGLAWKLQISSLANADRLPVSTRRNVVFLDAAFFSLGENLPETALAFQNALIRALDDNHANIGRPDGYIQRARIFARLGDISAASSDANKAEEAISADRDLTLRDRHLADLRALRAELLVDSQPDLALEAVNAAIRYYHSASVVARSARVLMIRARCKRNLGDLAGAEADLEAAFAAFQQETAVLRSPEDRMRAFDLERAAVAELVRFQAVDRGDSAAALRFAEQARAKLFPNVLGQRPLDVLDPLTARARLPPGVAVVYFAVLRDRVVAWAFSARTSKTFVWSIAVSDLDVLTARIRRRVQEGANLARFAAIAAVVNNALIRPALRSIPDAATIVFVADGPLADLPFNAFLDEAGRPLIRTRNVVVAPSLSSFVDASERLRGFVPDGVTAVGDGHNPRRTGLPRLSLASQEIRQIAKLYPAANILDDAAATSKRVLAAARRHPVLHFSTHAVANHAFPLFSRLLLAPDPFYGDDGVLLARDLAQQDLRSVSVVVLATCDGAAGPTFSGEGTVSLARIFLSAGASSVIASLWPVDDRINELLLTFHRQLRQRHDAATALRAAQLSVLASFGESAPVQTWAGFIALGGVKVSNQP